MAFVVNQFGTSIVIDAVHSRQKIYNSRCPLFYILLGVQWRYSTTDTSLLARSFVLSFVASLINMSVLFFWISRWRPHFVIITTLPSLNIHITINYGIVLTDFTTLLNIPTIPPISKFSRWGKKDAQTRKPCDNESVLSIPPLTSDSSKAQTSTTVVCSKLSLAYPSSLSLYPWYISPVSMTQHDRTQWGHIILPGRRIFDANQVKDTLLLPLLFIICYWLRRGWGVVKFT